MKLLNINALVDNIGLLVGLLVDLLTVGVCMWVLAPDALTRVGFLCISVVVVLFSVRAWFKRKKLLWAMFAAIAFFFDTSFTLEATKIQSLGGTVNVENDMELQRLTSEAENLRNAWLDLQAQYKDAQNRTTLDQLDSQIKAAKASYDEAESLRKSRFSSLENSGSNATKSLFSSSGVRLTADAIFLAIPNAIKDSRLIPLAVFSLIFAGLQLTIINSINRGEDKSYFDMVLGGHIIRETLSGNRVRTYCNRIVSNTKIDSSASGICQTCLKELSK